MRMAMSTPSSTMSITRSVGSSSSCTSGMARQELRQHRRQLVGGEGERRGDAQQTVRRAALAGDLVLERLDLAHDALRGGVEGLALLGEMQARASCAAAAARPAASPAG